MTNPKTKPKFQSQEDYLRDYDAYKKGYKYKIMYISESEYKSMYVYWRITDIFRQRLNPVGIVDLVFKFRNIL